MTPGTLSTVSSEREGFMKRKQWIACLCILLCGGVLLWFAQLLLVPKYMSGIR